MLSRLLGVMGNINTNSARASPSPIGWTDFPEEQVGTFYRGHWLGVFPWTQWEAVNLQTVDGQKVLKTKNRYREEHPEVSTTVDPNNDDWLTIWVTSSFSSPAPGVTHETPNLLDGVYQLRVVGYRYNAGTGKLFDEKIMPLCPGPGGDVDPAKPATMYLRLDNRSATSVAGSVHLNTTEPDCDFPDICAVVKNEGKSDQQCVGACGIVRVKKGDTLTIHFQATDADGHLEAYAMSAHWAESDVFNVLSAGAITADPDHLYGPTYTDTFLGAQGVHRAALPPVNPEHTRPIWFGGHFKATVTVDAVVPANPHRAFETCCAYLLRLEVWKRTTDGCTGGYYFHRNQCEFSFTIIREDLIGNPAFPSCTE